MEAPRLTLHAAPDPGDERFALVRRWPGTSGETKLAWWQLLELSKFGSEAIAPSDAEIGEWQGNKPDAGRARRRRLLEAGMIRWIDESRGLIAVVDPYELNETLARPLSVMRGDSQRQLFECSPTSAPSGDAPPTELVLRRVSDDRSNDHPAAPLPLKPSWKDLSQTSPSPSFGATNKGNSRERSSERSSGVRPIGDLVGQVVPPAAAMGDRLADEQSRVIEYARWLQREINAGAGDGDEMFFAPCEVIARGAVGDRLPPRQQAALESEIRRVLAGLAAGKYRSKRSSYANGAFNRLRRQFSLD